MKKVEVSIVNKMRIIDKVSDTMLSLDKMNPQYYKLTLPSKTINMWDIEDGLFRIVWVASEIFGRSDLNTKNVELIGFPAALKSSD